MRTLIGWVLAAVAVVGAGYGIVQTRSVEIDDPAHITAEVTAVRTGASKRCFVDVIYELDGHRHTGTVEATRALCRNPPTTLRVTVDRANPTVVQSEAMEGARGVVPWIVLGVLFAAAAMLTGLRSRRSRSRG